MDLAPLQPAQPFQPADHGAVDFDHDANFAGGRPLPVAGFPAGRHGSFFVK
jgi:hypothetical protein